MKTQRMIVMRNVLILVLSGLFIMGTSCQSGKAPGGDAEGKPGGEQTTPVEVPETDLHTAALLGDMGAIKGHIQAGSDLNVAEATVGSSPLITAAVFGKTAAARALLEAGADVNFQNREGSAALHTAAFLCRTEIVELLLAHGADRELKNIWGSTALQSVEGPFQEVKSIYDMFNTNLGPLGFKVEDEFLKETRPLIAQILRNE